MKIKDIDKQLAEAVTYDGYGWREASYKKRIKPKPVKETKARYWSCRKW